MNKDEHRTYLFKIHFPVTKAFATSFKANGNVRGASFFPEGIVRGSTSPKVFEIGSS